MGAGLEAGCRIWFERDGRYAMGAGAASILRKVRELGSLRKAAEALRMPYRGAWGRIRKAEDALGVALLAGTADRRRGLSLTPEAVELLDAYSDVEAGCRTWLAEAVSRHPCLSRGM